MRHGSDWYKRYPTAFLGGVQGMTTKEHAVYSVVLDLIYAHGGSVNNDPAWIAGWIKDMGAASVRRTITLLCDRGKLTIEGDQITQKLAKTEAKTKENLRETAQKNGSKGGKKSAEIRSLGSKNNGLREPTASTEKQADKIREDKSIGGGGSAREELTFRESVLVAAGHDPSGVTANGKIVGNQADFAAFEKALSDLSISEDEAIVTVSEVSQQKRDGPPSSLSYFIGALQRYAGARNSPEVSAIVPIGGHTPKSKNPTTADLKAMLKG